MIQKVFNTWIKMDQNLILYTSKYVTHGYILSMKKRTQRCCNDRFMV